MKFDKQKSSPHPVLRPYSSDYSEEDFQANTEVSFAEGSQFVDFDVSYAISSEYLSGLVDEGKAEYVASVSCSETLTRHTLASSERKYNIQIDKDLLKGKIEVSHFVVAAKSFILKSSEFNSEYCGASFEVDRGDVLAQDEPVVLYVDRDVFEKISSVVVLVLDDTIDDYDWKVDLDEHQIRIRVNNKLKNIIENARNDSKNVSVLVNSLYFTSIMHAVQCLGAERDVYEGYRWAQIVFKQMHNLNLDIELQEPYEIVQILLNRPIAVLANFVFEGGME